MWFLALYLMVAPSRAPLEGLVEVDESYIGGPRPGVRGRGAQGKTAVACAVEKNGGKTGRVRLPVIENCSREKLQAFVKGQLKEESTVHTDGWRAYVGIENSGYAHIRDVVDGRLEEAYVVLPTVHLVFAPEAVAPRHPPGLGVPQAPPAADGGRRQGRPLSLPQDRGATHVENRGWALECRRIRHGTTKQRGAGATSP
jgi:transposase-like protein